MDAARISALLHPFIERTLPEVQLQQISTYIDLLLRWNARINLTAIRNPDEIVTRHFGESFFMARHLFPEASVARTLLSASRGRSCNHFRPMRKLRSRTFAIVRCGPPL